MPKSCRRSRARPRACPRPCSRIPRPRRRSRPRTPTFPTFRTATRSASTRRTRSSSRGASGCSSPRRRRPPRRTEPSRFAVRRVRARPTRSGRARSRPLRRAHRPVSDQGLAGGLAPQKRGRGSAVLGDRRRSLGQLWQPRRQGGRGDFLRPGRWHRGRHAARLQQQLAAEARPPVDPIVPIYLLVASRDDVGSAANTLASETSVWVVIHPQTGRAQVSNNVPQAATDSAALRAARAKARAGIPLGK